MASRAWDLLDRRILGGVRFVDARGALVTAPVAVSAPDGVRWFVKRPGTIVITDVPGLEGHAGSFAALPPLPAIGSITVPLDLKPLDAGYGARRFVLRLPRDPDPAAAASLFAVADVVLPPTTAARVSGLVAGLRVRVTRSDDGRAIEGALVRLRPGGGPPETVALTGADGEALVLSDAIPLASPGPGAVMLGDFAARLDARVDPAVVRFHADAEVFAARQAAEARSRGLIDLDAIGAPATPAIDVRIAAGRIGTAAIAWTPP
jgi:hypothetical protein